MNALTKGMVCGYVGIFGCNPVRSADEHAGGIQYRGNEADRNMGIGNLCTIYSLTCMHWGVVCYRTAGEFCIISEN